MAQFLTLLPVLLLLAVFNPIVCPNGQMFNERRDRSPYIESNERSPQYLGDTPHALGGGSRSRKAPSHKDINAMNHRSREQFSSSLSSPPPQGSYIRQHPNNYEQTPTTSTTDSDVEKNIRIIFSTDFGPGLHIFNNTANHYHPDSYNDQMLADQPHSQEKLSSMPSNAKDIFKVQRSPDGKLSLVYNHDYVPKDAKDKSFYSNNDSSDSSSSEKNRFQTHFPAGLHNDSQSIATNHKQNKDDVIYFPTEEPGREEVSYTIDTKDCVEKDGRPLEKDGKPFCTNLRNYPEEKHLEQIIKQRFSNLESFFGEDLVIPQNISQRMNNEPNEEFLCKSRTRVIYPQAGLNKDYDWLIIVNIPNYKQGIHIEECMDAGQPCGVNNGLSLPNHYTATCKQSYIYRHLVAYTNDTVIKDQFKMPSCCKCVLRTG